MHRIFYLLIVITLISCINSGENQDHISSQQDTQENKAQITTEDLKGQLEDREYWQKPNEVIDKLGDLSDKTVADLGAGIGYFSFKLLPEARKVIAIDVDTSKINLLTKFKSSYHSSLKNKLDIRLASAGNPHLNPDEVDIIFIVNTIAYISSRTNYFENLKSTLKEDGRIVIVDFKTKRIPEHVNAPPYSSREYLHVLEDELIAAGYKIDATDDTSLDYQFMIFARKE